MYKVLLNNQDITNYCTKLPENINAKEKLDLFLLPEFSFEFLNYKNWLGSLDNIYYKDIKIQLINQITNEILIEGNIFEIEKTDKKITIKIGNQNDKFKELAKIGSWTYVNPAVILYEICNYFLIPVNKFIYNKTKALLDKNLARINFYPDNEITLIEFINKLKEYTNLDIYISNDRVIIDLLNQKNDTSFYLTDKDILKAEIKKTEDIFTNYSFIYAGGNVEIIDNNSNNLFYAERLKYGNIPLNKIEADANSIIQYPDKETGIYFQEERLKYYSKEKRIFEIELPISKYFNLQLKDIISWQSNYFELNNTFEILEKRLDFNNGKIELTIKEIKQNVVYSKSLSGYGLTPFGDNYGN